MKIKFPALHKGCTKVSSEQFVVSDYIYVRKHNAFVISQDLGNIVGVDLNILFSAQHGEEPDEEVKDDLDHALDVLDYLDDSFIAPALWAQLVAADSWCVPDFGIEAKNVREYIEIDSQGMTQKLYRTNVGEEEELKGFKGNYQSIFAKSVVKEQLAVRISSFNFDFLIKLNAMFGTKVKNDVLIAEHIGDYEPKRFTFKENRHIYGLLGCHKDVAQELFLPLTMENYLKSTYGTD